MTNGDRVRKILGAYVAAMKERFPGELERDFPSIDKVVEFMSTPDGFASVCAMVVAVTHLDPGFKAQLLARIAAADDDPAIASLTTPPKKWHTIH